MCDTSLDSSSEGKEMSTTAVREEPVSPMTESTANMALFRSLFGLVKREGENSPDRSALTHREGLSQFFGLWDRMLCDFGVREACERGDLLFVRMPFSMSCFFFCAEDGVCCRVGPFFTERPSQEELRIRLQQAGIRTPDEVYAYLSTAPLKDERELGALSLVLQKVLNRDPQVIDATKYQVQHARVSSDVRQLELEQRCAAAAERAELLIGRIFLAFQAGNEQEVRSKAAEFASLIRENAGFPEVFSTLRLYLQEEIAEILTYQYDRTREKQSIFLLSECMDRIRWQSSAENLIRIQNDFLNQALQMADSRSPEAAPSDRRVRDLMDYIHVHYAEKLSLSRLAEVTELGTSYLSSLFRRETGMTISTYIRKTRIGHAQLLLHYLNISVTEVSYQCGYQDVSYFIKDFRRETGFSPVEYRKSQRFNSFGGTKLAKQA